MLQPSTISFLKELRKNNNKPWFDKNKNKYLSAKTDFESFVQKIIIAISVFDEDVKELFPKNCTFRINRDIRFSKDKTPYKSNMGASFNKGGKKSISAGYYFNLEPGGKSFAGGGLWMPQPPELKNVRQEIDYNFLDFKTIINSKTFKNEYGTLEMNEKDKLVNVPKGYDKENPAAEFLKLKSFVAIKTIADNHLTSAGLLKEITTAFKALMPLVKFINRSME